MVFEVRGAACRTLLSCCYTNRYESWRSLNRVMILYWLPYYNSWTHSPGILPSWGYGLWDTVWSPPVCEWSVEVRAGQWVGSHGELLLWGSVQLQVLRCQKTLVVHPAEILYLSWGRTVADGCTFLQLSGFLVVSRQQNGSFACLHTVSPRRLLEFCWNTCHNYCPLHFSIKAWTVSYWNVSSSDII